jgi:phosphoglycolate phosphatase
MPMRKLYDLIIFDWDGTLVDSQAQIISCMSKAFDKVGLPRPDSAAVRHIIGLSLEAAASRLAPEADRSTIEALVDCYRDFALSNSDHSTQIFDGVNSGLRELRRQGFYLAVATGKGRMGLEAALEDTELKDLFDITRCADETSSKPNPLMLEEILTDLNLGANKAIMVGDTSYDIEMANSIGMDSIAVTYGMHEEFHLRPLRPKYLIHHFTEILSLTGENTDV